LVIEAHRISVSLKHIMVNKIRTHTHTYTHTHTHTHTFLMAIFYYAAHYLYTHISKIAKHSKELICMVLVTKEPNVKQNTDTYTPIIQSNQQ